MIILNEEINDIIKIVQALEDSNTLLKGVTKAIENKTKKIKKRVFKYVVGYFSSYFILKPISRKRYYKSWFRK